MNLINYYCINAVCKSSCTAPLIPHKGDFSTLQVKLNGFSYWKSGISSNAVRMFCDYLGLLDIVYLWGYHGTCR